MDWQYVTTYLIVALAAGSLVWRLVAGLRQPKHSPSCPACRKCIAQAIDRARREAERSAAGAAR